MYTPPCRPQRQRTRAAQGRASLRGRAICALLAALATPILQADEAVQTIGFDGMGRVRIGMPMWELLRVLDDTLVIEPLLETCTHVYTASGEPGEAPLLYMLIDGRLARIEVRTPAVPTHSGVRVGDTEADVQAAYPGRVQIEPHAYEEGHYLRVESADGHSALVFDTDGNRIRSFRIGRLPAARWVEGCS